MSARPSSRSVARSAFRDLIFRLCALAGLGVGLLLAMGRPEPAAPDSCAADKADRVGECVGDGLVVNFAPYAVGVAGGLLVGAVFGALLARLLVPEPVPRGTARATTPGR